MPTSSFLECPLPLAYPPTHTHILFPLLSLRSLSTRRCGCDPLFSCGKGEEERIEEGGKGPMLLSLSLLPFPSITCCFTPYECASVSWSRREDPFHQEHLAFPRHFIVDAVSISVPPYPRAPIVSEEGEKWCKGWRSEIL